MSDDNREPILRIRGVTRRFGGLTAIRNVTIDVPHRSIFSVIGPNGAGKTTLFNCITGFYRPNEGEIIFEGRPIHGLRPDQITKGGIARTYQNIHLFGGMTALENILVGMHSRLESGPVNAILRLPDNRAEEDAALARAYELLRFIDLPDVGDMIASNLPYGSQRRLEIARALASSPSLLLLDEPTAGMNLQETDDIMHFIRRLRDERGLTVLLIEHHMELVMNVSEHIAVLDFGQKIAEGTPEEIQNNPRVIEAYLGAPADQLHVGAAQKPAATGETAHGAA
ncbi:MAG: ABC transporter ATP-binding protein [Anaerolineae bacterium]|nr:ABC transporter ATP-binding protein [Anaerolineae bacterium]